MRETLLLDVPHREVVFTIPKMLRVFFKFKRKLLGSFADAPSDEVDPMVCPQCGGTMKIIAFITEYDVVDRIIDHLKIRFVPAKW